MNEMTRTQIIPTEQPESRETKLDLANSLDMFKKSLSLAREEAEGNYNKIKAELSDLIEERKKLRNKGIIQTDSTAEEIETIDRIVLSQADKGIQMAVFKKIVKALENINDEIQRTLKPEQQNFFQIQNTPSRILEIINYSIKEITEIITESDPRGPMEGRIRGFLSETDAAGKKYFNWNVIDEQKMFADNLIFEITHYRDIFKSLYEKKYYTEMDLNNFENTFNKVYNNLHDQKTRAQSKLDALLSERNRLEQATGGTATTNESIEAVALSAGKITILLNSARGTIQELDNFKFQIENEKFKLKRGNIVVSEIFLIKINVLIEFLEEKMEKINMKNPPLRERAEDFLLHDTDQKDRENFDFDLTDEYVDWANNLISKLNELKNKLKSYAT